MLLLFCFVPTYEAGETVMSKFIFQIKLFRALQVKQQRNTMFCNVTWKKLYLLLNNEKRLRLQRTREQKVTKTHPTKSKNESKFSSKSGFFSLQQKRSHSRKCAKDKKWKRKKKCWKCWKCSFAFFSSFVLMSKRCFLKVSPSLCEISI